MKNAQLYKLTLLLLLTLGLNSCGFIEGVFKTGVGVGVFLVVILIVIVIALVARIGKK